MRKRGTFAGLAAAVMLVLSGEAWAGDRPVGVVELFTSQGCSSCPPADEIFGELASTGDVVALGYHVDYWDYLGWKDTLGSPRNTARQRDYARALDGSVYTPQAVINGRAHVVGSREGAMTLALETMADTADGLTVDVSISMQDDSVVIETGPGGVNAPEAHVVLVYFLPRQTVEVRRGENRGRTIEYWNAVTDFQTIGMWHGEGKRFELPMSEIDRRGGGCAVLLQSVAEGDRPGPILGAAIVGAGQS